MSKRRLVRAAGLLLACFWTGPWAAAGDGLDEKLPSLDGLVRYGCSVKGPITQIDYADPGGRTRKVWSVTFWAEHMSAFGTKIRKDWKLLYSSRKRRSRSLTDCDKFLEKVSKAQQARTAPASGHTADQRNPRDGS